MPEALINHRVLEWARQQARLQRAELAKIANATEAQISSWEQGSSRPSLAKAMEIAKALRIPFAALFLSEPPIKDNPIPDLRTVGDHPPLGPLSIDLTDAIELAILKQQWFRTFHSSTSNLNLEQSTDVINLSAIIRSSIGWGDSVRHDNSGSASYLTALSKLAEKFGILVLRSGVVGNNNSRKLKVAEFRGFALADEVAPLLFINSNDAQTAQVFTFAHELTHIWMGSSGVSSSSGVQDAAPASSLESFCNKVAAELIAPTATFRSFWRTKPSYKSAASFFRISEQVALRRAADLQLVSEREFYDSLSRIPVRGPGRKSKGGNFDTTLPARNSVRFTRTLLSEVSKNRMDVREASRLLSVKPSTLVKLASRRTQL